jgi:hypothetical protein
VAGVLATFADLVIISDFVVVVAIVLAIVVGALFVSGRIAPSTESVEQEADDDDDPRPEGQLRNDPRGPENG